MNGAAMNCRQDPGLGPQHQDSSSLHNPGYHLQINRQQNLQHQNSKTLNYPSFSTNYQVDGFYDNVQQYENIVDSRLSVREVKDPRLQRPGSVRCRNEPIDLPVPQFVIDEHSVSNVLNANHDLVQGSKGLDLDTRIGLLIKSKALAGMHPIFSDLNESEESESDLDDPFLSRPKSKCRIDDIASVPRVTETTLHECFDDPERPLSRPPSPFLSRATYLFWFNKAIEIKQQAKAQEQALLEQAAKRLIQDAPPSLKTNQSLRPSPKRPILKNLVDEISKELKEVIKQEFIREVIEQTAFNTLDDWWEKQNQDEKQDALKNEPEPLKTPTNTTNENYKDSFNVNTKSQGSTSPKIPFPWKKDENKKRKFQEEENCNHTCNNENIPSENKVLRENHEESLNGAHPVNRDTDTISGNCHSQEDLVPRPKESSSEDLHKNSQLNYQEASSLVKCCSFITDNRACDLDKESAELMNEETPRSNTCASKVFVESNEISPFIPSNADKSLDGKIDDRLLIVKDILDFIFCNVNKTVEKRNDDKTPYKKVNKKLDCPNYSNYPISMDSLVSENIKSDSPKEC